jgi:hypothetical protein
MVMFGPIAQIADVVPKLKIPDGLKNFSLPNDIRNNWPLNIYSRYVQFLVIVYFEAKANL